MKPLEAARRLAGTDPEVADFCFACGGYNEHYDDCLWLHMPKIVEALKAGVDLALHCYHLDWGEAPDSWMVNETLKDMGEADEHGRLIPDEEVQ